MHIYDNMKCKTETDLVNAFVTSFMNSLPRNRYYKALCEIETTWGIADTIIVSVRKKALTNRRRLLTTNSPTLTNLSALALVWLEDHPCTDIETMGTFLHTRNGTTRGVAELLCERGLIRLFKDGGIQRRSLKDILVIKDILVFEAKLTKWRID